MSKFGIEPGTLGGRSSSMPMPRRRTQDDADAEMIAQAHAMDARAFRKRFPAGSAQQAELNAALRRQALRKQEKN